jgi:hypothetical protein
MNLLFNLFDAGIWGEISLLLNYYPWESLPKITPGIFLWWGGGGGGSGKRRGAGKGNKGKEGGGATGGRLMVNKVKIFEKREKNKQRGNISFG